LKIPDSYVFDGSTFEYKLTSAIIHSGTSLEFGHYYAFVIPPHEDSDRCFLLNDEQVSVVSRSFLATLASAWEHDTPYLLFYELMHRSS
jgi:uncharacterized UBP type Zn finger protein